MNMFSDPTFNAQIRSALATRLDSLEQDNERIAARIANNSSTAYSDVADQAGSELCNDLDLLQYDRNMKAIDQINSALRDMDHASYGHCKLCGEPIGIKRLLAMPHAKYCIECQESMDQGPSMHVGSRSGYTADLRF
jgi:DnaK suppressor protein